MEVIIDGIVYVPKETRPELDLLKSKYGSGDYIVIYYSTVINNWNTVAKNKPLWDNNVKYKLIHTRHKDILDAWLEDNSVEIKAFYLDWFYEKDFIKNYNENTQYYLIQEYPIFKRNPQGEVFKQLDDYECVCYLSFDENVIGQDYKIKILKELETIQYDKERGLYHLQPVFYKPNDIDCCIDFYDAKYCQLVRRGAILKYYNIEPITPEQLKTMPFVWEMYKKYKG